MWAGKGKKKRKTIWEYDTSIAAFPVFALPCIIYVICAVSAADSDNTALYLEAKYHNVIVTVALTLFSQLFHIKWFMLLWSDLENFTVLSLFMHLICQTAQWKWMIGGGNMIYSSFCSKILAIKMICFIIVTIFWYFSLQLHSRGFLKDKTQIFSCPKVVVCFGAETFSCFW